MRERRKRDWNPVNPVILSKEEIGMMEWWKTGMMEVSNPVNPEKSC
jgi:hypothetical protein